MLFTFFIWIAEDPPTADQSAMCAMNRHLLWINLLMCIIEFLQISRKGGNA